MMDLIEKIMPKLSQLLNKVNDDKLINISIDEAWDNGLLLTFQVYNGCDYTNETYQMRAILGRDRIIYENAVNGVDYRDFVEIDADISLEEYDAIMNL